MGEVFPPYHVFINHRGPDVKNTLASYIYHRLITHGLRVFLDKPELQAGDSLTPAIKSAICSASVQISIFSKTYAKSTWCLDELVWMFDSRSSKIIPIFYDIEPSDLRHVEKGAYAGAFQDHRDKARVSKQHMDSWISALDKVSGISGVVINTEKDDHGERLEKIVEIVLEKVGREELDVCEYPVGLRQAAERFEQEVLSPSELRGTKVVAIVGPGGSGKSTLVTHLYNSKCSQFHRSCFLSDVSERDLPSLQQTLLRDLLRDQNLLVQDRRRGRSLLRDRLRGLTSVLIVFDGIDNTEQIEDLLFVKDVLGNGSLILVTCRDQTLLVSYKIEIYNVKLLDEKHAQELFCWHAFRHTKPHHDLQAMVKELVRICSGFPLALKVLAGQLHNEGDPTKWKQHLERLRQQLPNNLLKQIVMDSYESLDDGEKEAFLDVAHFLTGEDADLVKRVLDGSDDNASQCLQTLRHKCLVDFESADITGLREIPGESVNWRRAKGSFKIRMHYSERDLGESVNWRRAKGSFKIRMHDLVRDLARQIGRQELPLRLCCSNDKMISTRVFGSHGSVQKYDVRGIRRDEGRLLRRILGDDDRPLRRILEDDKRLLREILTYEDHLPVFLRNQHICGLKLLSVQDSTILQKFNSVSGDLTWFRWRQFVHTPFLQMMGLSEDTSNPFSFLQRSLSNLLLRSLRVLEVNGVSPQDFRNFVDDREPPSQLGALEVTCTHDFESRSTAGPSTAETSDSSQPQLGKLPLKYADKMLPGRATAVSPKHGSAAETSDSSQPPINFGQWFHGWLGKLNFKYLDKIVLQNIQGLTTLPIKFEEVRNLRHVDLSYCRDLKVLPVSFTEELLQLQYLALRDCRKLVLQDLGKISTLEHLNFEGCSMLWEMPKGTEVQKSLKYLNVVHTNLRKLPQHLEQLEHLEELHIGSPELRDIPSSLYNLSRLTDLTLLGCTKLLFIDNSIEKLVRLESFRIYNCGLRALPERIAWMNMKVLDVRGCPLLLSKQLLIGVDSGNMPLDSSKAQGSIDQGAYPNRSSCLTDLIIRESGISEIHIPWAEGLFPKLEIVDLSGNHLLTDIGSLPGSLISLKLMDCSKLRTLACLSNMARLKILDISGCNELETLNVEGLSSIEVIKSSGCWQLRNIQGLHLLEKLSFFQISFNRIWYTPKFNLFPGFHPSLGSLTILEELESCTEASFQTKDYNFTDVKLKGAILLYLITHPDCKIEVTLDHAYTSHSYKVDYSYHSKSVDNSVHILMWTKDSEVFDDFKFSNDDAIHFNITINISAKPFLKTTGLKKGWMVEAKNVLEMSSFLSYDIAADMSDLCTHQS